MTNEPSLKDLYDLILQLNAKIDRMEQAIKTNTNSFSTDIPESTIIEWISNCEVSKEDIGMVYDNNGCIAAIKNCILRNHNTVTIPLIYNKNTLYVYESSGWSKWTEEHLHVLIRDIWRKFVYFHMHAESDPSIDDDMKDFQRKRILEMRQKIYDVKKNRLDMYRWIKNIILKN
jgi:hypothetical protein